MKTCPYCAEDVKDEAIICPHCRKDLRITPKQEAEAQAAKGKGAAILIAVACLVIGVVLFPISDVLAIFFIVFSLILGIGAAMSKPAAEKSEVESKTQDET